MQLPARRIVVCVIGVIFAICISAQNTEYPSYFRTAPRLNLRERPSRSAKRIVELKNEAQVKVLGVDSDGWAQLIYKGDTVYAFADYLDYVGPVSVLTEPDRSSKIKWGAWRLSELLLIGYIIYALIRLYRIVSLRKR